MKSEHQRRAPRRGWVVEGHIFVVKKLTAVGLESEGNTRVYCT